MGVPDRAAKHYKFEAEPTSRNETESQKLAESYSRATYSYSVIRDVSAGPARARCKSKIPRQRQPLVASAVGIFNAFVISALSAFKSYECLVFSAATLLWSTAMTSPNVFAVGPRATRKGDRVVLRTRLPIIRRHFLV